MTQDTRKDRRVKIVSLNVRYKSATVDEFIENHAHDVSRGGIYIKTGSPFPPGTLLKFEIRLASDQAVITGVGRVVWKRDTSQGTSERPSGMGVKFIKIDEPSKTVIDRLVNSRSDAGRSYESESEMPHAEPTPAAAAARPISNRPAANRVGKSTMLGIGSVAGASVVHSVPRPGGSVPPRPSGGGGMFPKAVPEEDTAPKQEQTVMKQAAELLEEALREAGGSMEDVGTNPLFAGTTAAAPSDKVEVKPASLAPGESSGAAAEAARARAMVAGMSAGQPKKAQSDPPRTSRESPGAKVPDRIEPRPASARPSGRTAVSSAPPRPPRKKGAGGTLVILVVAAAAAAVGVVYRGAIFGEPEAAPTPSAAQATPAPPSASAAAAAPSASEAPAASAEPGASASAAAAASASSAPSASAAASATPTPSATAAPAVVRVRPKPAAPAAVPAATAAATARDDSAGASPTTEPAATAPPKATATSAPTAPAPKKPAKPADDNPY